MLAAGRPSVSPVDGSQATDLCFNAAVRPVDNQSTRQQRHLAYIQHPAGTSHVVANCLSRPAAAEVPSSPVGPVSWVAMAAGQTTCGQLVAAWAQGGVGSLHLQRVAVEGGSTSGVMDQQGC